MSVVMKLWTGIYGSFQQLGFYRFPQPTGTLSTDKAHPKMYINYANNRSEKLERRAKKGKNYLGRKEKAEVRG